MQQNTESNSTMDAFRHAVLTQPKLQYQMRRAAHPQDVVQIATLAGYNIRAVEFEKMNLAGGIPGTLPETEKEDVWGALPCWCDPSVVVTKSC